MKNNVVAAINIIQAIVAGIYLVFTSHLGIMFLILTNYEGLPQVFRKRWIFNFPQVNMAEEERTNNCQMSIGVVGNSKVTMQPVLH